MNTSADIFSAVIFLLGQTHLESPVAVVNHLEWDQRMQLMFNTAFLWIGLSTAAGCSAKLLVPGTYPRGTVSTLLTGFFSTSLAAVGMGCIFGADTYNPISFLGLVTSVSVACITLTVYRKIFRPKEK